MASTISAKDFKDALDRYPALLKGLSKPPKEGSLSLEDLDKYRYESAPASFSKKTGRTMEGTDVQKLVDWKMRHGIWRPSLPKLVKKNTDEAVTTALKDAFTHYASHPDDIAVVITKLTALKGVGPSTASLLLSVHDPANVIFFSDELYRWLCADGEKVSPKYTTKEFEELFAKAKTFRQRIQCTPIELEKAAFVIIKESEPAREPKPKYQPSGLPRGRPAKPESEKKVKIPSGRGRGRPKKETNGVVEEKAENPQENTSNTNARGRGRPKKVVEEPDKRKAKSEEVGGQTEETQEESSATPSRKRKAASETPTSVKKSKA